MDLISKIVALAAIAYVCVMLVLLVKELAKEHNAKLQARVDAEIDRLHK